MPSEVWPAPLVFEDEETCASMTQVVLDAHACELDKNGGFQSDRNEDAEIIESVVSTTFVPLFGMTPEQRFADIFEQAAYFALHIAKRHAFVDCNKRTSLMMLLYLLAKRHLGLDLPDTKNIKDNKFYDWITRLVDGSMSVTELTENLRSHAIYI